MRFLRVEVQMKNTNNLNKSRLMRLIIAGVMVTIALLTLLIAIGESDVNASAASTSTGIIVDVNSNNILTGDNYSTSTASRKYYYTRTNFSNSNSASSVNMTYVNYDTAGGTNGTTGTETLNVLRGAAVGNKNVSVADTSFDVGSDNCLTINVGPAAVSNTAGRAPLYFTFGLSEDVKNLLKN